ncbi:MAG TPA: nicotinate phosphoribosyltransferase, partial [Firmicutes bacterium]|nr:nicotinate phosphoribosyltransferase [Bacillota bacterium]
MPTFRHLDEVRDYDPGPRLLNSATPEEVAMGATTDIYFLRTYELLERLGKLDVAVVAEIFSSRAGVMAGSGECHNLLRERKVTVWALPEGEEFAAKEVVMRIAGPYGEFGLMETPLLGILASNTAWATAARQCRDAAKGRPVICFGARHVHPAVAPVMERAALVGGVSGASCIMAARLAGRQPAGTIPHAAVLIVGDTVTVAHAYHRYMPPDAPRIVLVDTFKDEAEESLRVAEALGEHLAGIRLDTPQERGGVTPELVREVKER